MFKLVKFATSAILLCITLAAAGSAIAQKSNTKFPGIGRDATPAEVAAWDIDVRPDFKGLPKGSGSVEKGQQLWESKCAVCHGPSANPMKSSLQSLAAQLKTTLKQVG